ncbi:hypothetical protein CAPTEDRAFT_165703 [Capitella teleta]|uniref:Chitin-binding type-2 domain-containing protein n=1 Tax=Capitella teleta TaxID=283909 RepID=X1ZAF7_CAPTE|nr:hypothetical protein CAPTEDRAFT_165703 [Capitella teleta]|eukprot:ELU00357.1 hypothetical protein CAPTEDRAFT_165703 [Capitella teleta]
MIASLIFLAASVSASFDRPEYNEVGQLKCNGDSKDPWFADPDDCACYYVCQTSANTAVRMCCHDGLWWQQETKTCVYRQDFTQESIDHCSGLGKGPGTTAELREIFMGRCWEYQRFIAPVMFKASGIDCQALFDSFAKAFVGMAPCGDVPPEAYDQLVEASSMELPPDTSLFWSGDYFLAQNIANRGQRMFTLESTLIGYIMNDLTWCGQRQSPGINFDTCPLFATCENHVMASLWVNALERYAAQASGVVTVLLNGSRADGEAFRNNSFFAMHELPNLSSEKVDYLRVWVAHDLDVPSTETCETGSLKLLAKIAEEKGIGYECEDNPASILHLMCVDHPLNDQCTAPEVMKPTRSTAKATQNMAKSTRSASTATESEIEPTKSTLKPTEISTSS